VPVTIFTAKRIITMNPANPYGTAVAVREGRVLGVGSIEELSGWGEHTVDDTFADLVLLPGFVEAHSHGAAGAMWAMPYVGYFDRTAPDGTVWSGCRSIAEVVSRLQSIEAEMSAGGVDDSDPLVAWGLDPIYFSDERMYAHHLDDVSTVRPVYIQHASFHLATVNTALLISELITSDLQTPGVDLGSDGEPNGELQERPAMALATRATAKLYGAMETDEALWAYGHVARNAGHTTIADMGGGQLPDERVAQWRRVVDHPEFPARASVTVSTNRAGPLGRLDLAGRAAELREESSDKLRFGVVKITLDGSIQGFTARISSPYYYDPPPGHPGNGMWLIAPDQMAELVLSYHRLGLTIHCHCNGDEATEVFIDAVEQALEEHPRWDHRHTVQHCQLTTESQYRRMKALGMCANIFSNHMFYWGDQHRDLTVGPERARGMDACATALRLGVPFSIHSDAAVTPLGHLHVAWCAVNRMTASGDVLGEHERISVAQALHAITLGAAWQLKMDHEIGSIEAGKFADFAVLHDDPLEVDPMKLKDIGVWGTVLGGTPRSSSAS